MTFSGILKHDDSLKSLSPASRLDIKDAEKLLNLQFSKEYKDYLMSLGTAATSEHEFTGLCSSNRLNVVYVTNQEWSKHPAIPKSLYVVEKLNIDDIIIWQDRTGKVFQTVYDKEPSWVANSLKEYLCL